MMVYMQLIKTLFFLAVAGDHKTATDYTGRNGSCQPIGNTINVPT